jgi:hypothetical protein
VAKLDWSKKDLVNRCVRALKRHERVEDAAAEVGISADQLFHGVRVATGKTAGCYLKKPTLTPRPVEALAAKRKESNQRAREARLKAALTALEAEIKEHRERETILDRLSSPGKKPRIIRREITSNLREATALILASDWHFEETVDSVAVAGRNEYNVEIATGRIQRFFQSCRTLLELHREESIIRDVVLALLGDMITGFIHDELREENGLAPVEAVFVLQQLIIAGIDYLLEDEQIENLLVVCSYGNHGRLTKKRQSNGAKHSLEWLMYSQLKRHYAEHKRVTFEVTQSSDQYCEIYGETAHMTHGDSVNYNNGVGGIGVPVLRAVPRWEEIVKAKIHCIAHFHERQCLRGRVLVNGSLIGVTAYGKQYGYSEPQQTFALIDPKRWLMLERPIWVT